MTRKFGRVLPCLLLIALSAHATPLDAAPSRVVRIGVVVDWPVDRNTALEQAFRDEIRALAQGEFDVQFPAGKRVTTNRTRVGVHAALDRLLADREVDLVLTLGVLSSLEACRRRDLPKPVIAPFVVDTELAEVPLRQSASGMKNLSYVALPPPASRELQVFREIVPFDHFAFLFDRTLGEALPGLRSTMQSIAQAQNLTVEFVPVGASADEALAAIPAGTQAVYLAPLFGLSAEEFNRLVAGLSKKKLPSFSLLGVPDVERGILAGLAPEYNITQLARRVALNIQRIVLGDDAGTLPVAFPQEERLTINMATARAIGVWPSWQVLTKATLIHDEQASSGRQLSLAEAVQEAMVANLDLAVADREVAEGVQNVRMARSSLLPQVRIGSQTILIDDDRAKASLGAQRAQTVRGTTSLSQRLYDDDAWANFTAEQHRQVGREQDQERLRLDVVLQTATAYLNVLRAQTVERVQRDNLNRTRRNLEVARSRVNVGYAGPEEVYRWESEVATNQRNVITARAQTEEAKIALNRVRHRPLREVFRTQETDLSDPLLLTSDTELLRYVDDPWSLQLFSEFMTQEGLTRAPELQRLQALIDAQQRLIVAARRAFWLPKANLQGDVIDFWHRGGAGESSLQVAGFPVSLPKQKDLNWTVGFEFSLPLSTGGARQAELERAREELSRLYLERQATAERIAQRIHAASEQAGASYAGISLARDAAAAARRNLELVSDHYAHGTVGILDLIDAQNASFQADQVAANAVHQFLLDLMEVERAASGFDFFVTPEQQQAWMRRLKAFFAEAGVTPR